MSLSLKVKRTFLSFAQSYFSTIGPNWTWTSNPKTTKIFIGDKFSAKVAWAEKTPAIILSKGQCRWARTSIDVRKDYPGLSSDSFSKVRMDLALGSLTYQCLSSNGIEAEEIADLLFRQLIGYKDQFRINGIHQIMDIQLGEEQLIRGDNQARFFMVPINVTYSISDIITTSETLYDLRVYTNYDQILLFDKFDTFGGITYNVSGQWLLFNAPPTSGLTLHVDYVNDITLQNMTETISGIDGYSTAFMLSAAPYNFYEDLRHIDVAYSGVTVYQES